MRNWKATIENGVRLRKSIHNGDYQAIIEDIKACYKEMLDKGIIDQDDYENWTGDLDWLDIDGDDAQDNIDFELDNLYNACDGFRCLLAL